MNPRRPALPLEGFEAADLEAALRLLEAVLEDGLQAIRDDRSLVAIENVGSVVTVIQLLERQRQLLGRGDELPAAH